MAIIADGLTKQYGDKLAVDDLSLTIEPGRVTGFLGPNGAGKSTTMRMMLDIDRATSGMTTFDGARFGNLDSPLSVVGAMLDANAVEPRRSARDHLRYLAASAGLPDSRVDEVLGLTGMREAQNRKVGNFSLGMHQRLGIAAALLGDPKYMFFDEPTNGLDPEGIRWVREFLQQLAAEGRGILVSSHLLSELSLYVDHIVVIGKGRFIASGSVAEFESMTGHASVTVESPRLDELVALIEPRGGRVTPTPNGIEVTGMAASAIGDLAALHRIELHELHTEHQSLETTFLELTADSQEYRSTGTGREEAS
ncbi:ATP-binding cassette domain-containing protein [Ilumatobacter sp.]|uniref:ATP-binding cassette domain-containing protein n=1 Tax=Ilumatobacter sp. TaxID=1967498 RepID=UPI003AF605BD